MGVMEIFLKAMKIFAQSWKLMLPIFFIVSLPSSLLLISNSIFTTPLIRDMATKILLMRNTDPNSPDFLQLLMAFMEDARAYMGIEAVAVIISYIISLLLIMTTIYTSALACFNKPITMKDLARRVASTWQGPLITKLYSTLINLGYALWLTSLVIFFLFISNGSFALIALGFLLVLVGIVVGMYLKLVLYVGLVTSVVAEDCYGLQALGRASKIISKRKKQGFVVVLISWIVIAALLGVDLMLVYGFGKIKIEGAALTSGVVLLLVNVVVEMFIFVVYTVFWCESGEKRLDGEINYESLPVDADLP